MKLRCATTMTLDWIARRLCMGTRGSLAPLPRTAGQLEDQSQPGKPIRANDREQQMFKHID